MLGFIFCKRVFNEMMFATHNRVREFTYKTATAKICVRIHWKNRNLTRVTQEINSLPTPLGACPMMHIEHPCHILTQVYVS